jgi:hypothetical protein
MPTNAAKSTVNNWEVHQQSICEDCLQSLVNGEGGHTEKEIKKMNKTLLLWSEQSYEPAGINDDKEPFFSWKVCDLCGQKAGDRYKYNFFDKSKQNENETIGKIIEN